MNWKIWKDAILAGLATVGSIIANALGGWDTALQVLVGVMVADYISGILVALIWHRSDKTESGRLSSEAGFRGLAKKVGILVFVWVATMLDGVIGQEYVRTTVILFYIANEGLSVIENTAAMGVRYPAFIQRALEILRDKTDDGPEGGADPQEQAPEQLPESAEDLQEQTEQEHVEREGDDNGRV